MESNNEWVDVTEEEAKASLQPADEWEDITEEEAKASTGDEWEDVSVDEAEKSVAKDEISEMESFLHGFGEGASMGWSDEIVGRWKELVEGGDYEKARDEYRKYLKQARDANPNSALAGDVAGSVASGVTIGAVVPWANVGTAARLGHAAAVAGAEGAVSGYGRNEDSDNLAKDVATGAAAGAALGGAFNVGAKGLSKLFSKTGQKTIKQSKLPDEKVEEAFRMVNKQRDTHLKTAEKIDKLGTRFVAEDFPEYSRWASKRNQYTPEEMERVTKLGNQALDEEELKAVYRAGEQGRLTPASFLEFQEAKALHKVTKRLDGKHAGELPEHWASKKLQAINVKARQVDDVVPELKLEKDTEAMTKAVNLADQEVRAMNAKVGKLMSYLKNNNIKHKDLIKNYEAGALERGSGDLTGLDDAIPNPFESSEGIPQVKKLLDELYQDSKDKGYRIDYVENYIKKSFASNEDILNNLSAKLKTKVSPEEAEEMVRGFKTITGYEGRVKNLDNLKEIVEEYKLKPEKLARFRKSQELKSAYERDPNRTIPEWAREYDLAKLMRRSIRESVENHYLRPVGEKILFKANKLKKMGMDDQAEFWERYAKDNMGITPSVHEAKLTDYLKKMPLINKAVNNDTLQYIGRIMNNSPYISHLGLKPTKALKNLFQPINHSAPHMYGTSARGYGDIAKEHFKTIYNVKEVAQWARKNPQHTPEIKSYIKKGWINGESSVDQINDAIDVLKESGADINPFVKKFGDNWEKTANKLMVMFDMADKANRLTTIRATRTLSKNIMEGNKLGKQAIRQLPSATKQQALYLKKAGREQELTDYLTSHYLDKTQFAYNKASRTELARDARGLNTFQTWPVQITSEILYDVGKGDANKAAIKYGLPYATAFTIGAGLYSQYPEEYVSMFGKEGGAGFAGWQALSAFGGYGSLMGYQGDALKGMYDTGKKAIEETVSDSDYQEKAREAFARKVINSGYIPALKNASDLADFINDERGTFYSDGEE